MNPNHEKPLVVVAITSYLPFIGGAEVAVKNVCLRLAREYDFLILTARLRQDLPVREIRPEGTVLRLGIGNRIDVWLLPILGCFRILRMRGKRQPALLWGMDISQGALAAGLAAFFKPSFKFFLTVQYGESEERLRSGRLRMILRSFRFLLRRADQVSAISTYLIRVARSCGYDGSAERIPNGADAAEFLSGLERKNERTRSAPMIITVSRLVPKNGVDILIRAFAKIHTVVPGARLSIVGDGREREALEHLVQDLEIRDVVAFQGAVPPEQVPEFLCGADMFVRPSRSEGMGNAFVEALAAGLPVIGTPAGGIPDIIEEGITGLLVPPDDPEALARAMQFLLNDPSKARSMAEQGRRRVVKHFSWDAIAQSYRDIFEILIRAQTRILVAAPILSPDIGGPATYAAELLAELPKRGVLLRIVRFPRERVAPPGIRHALYFLRLLGAGRGCSAILALDPVSTGLPALIAGRVSGKPLVLKIGGDYAWEQSVQRFGVRDLLDVFLKKRYGFRVEALRFVQSFVARSAERVIVPSMYLKRVALVWGVREARIRIVPNAFDPPSAILSRDEARAELGVSGTLAVSAGRLVPWKGLALLIELAPTMRQKIPDFTLAIIGDGPEREKYELGIRNYELGNCVRLIGAIPQRDFLAYLRAADCFVLNSGYEGFSHAILEAMALGTLVVASRAGGNTEIIEDGINGFLVEYNDREELAAALGKVLRLDQEGKSAIAREARKKALSYSVSRMAEETVQVLADAPFSCGL